MDTIESKSWLAKYLWIVQLLLCSIGVILILMSCLVTLGSRTERILLSLGIVVVTSSILSMLLSLFGADVRTIVEETLGFQKQVHELGLERVHLRIGDESIFDMFPNAHRIDLMYNSARTTCYRYGEKISRAIADHGCRVRILIADPENPIWNDDNIKNAMCPGTDIPREIHDVLSHLKILINELNQLQPPLQTGSLEVKKYLCAPTNSIVIVDDKIARHIPYLPYVHSAEVPAFDVTKKRSSGLFEQYQNTFKRIWKKSNTIFKIEFPYLSKQ